MVSVEASAFEQVTRQMTQEAKNDLEEYKRRVNGSLDRIDQRLSTIERALNARPSWLFTGLLTGLTSLSTGLAVYVLTIPK